MTSAVSITPVAIPQRTGRNDPTASEPIGARVYAPNNPRHDTALVWLHGGGFAGGDLTMPEADWVAHSLAERGHLVVTVDYRLVTDTVRYPEPSNDVLTAWAWVHNHRDDLHLTGSVHLGGASAGGNLAAGATMRIRDNDPVADGAPLPTTLILAYPTLHAVQPPPSDDLRHKLDALAPEYQRDAAYVARLYINFLPDAATDATGAVVPAGISDVARIRAAALPGTADPTGLPPTLSAGSASDPLRASAEGFVQSLAAHGVEHEYFVEPDTRHGHLNQPDTVGALSTIEHFDAWLTDHAGR